MGSPEAHSLRSFLIRGTHCYAHRHPFVTFPPAHGFVATPRAFLCAVCCSAQRAAAATPQLRQALKIDREPSVQVLSC